jgi:predicted metal-dependent HD superfamily phosphohydrolase
MPAFETSWTTAWTALGAQADGLAEYRALLARYAEPHRAYHTRQHLAECLALFEEYRSLAQQPAEVCLALWYHDAIYDIPASDNETRSAALAATELAAAGIAANPVARIRELILATRHAAAPAGPDAALLVDIDLAILGADPARFAEYEAQIRREYQAVPEALFRSKRREILQTFLDRPQLFCCPALAARFEDAARANLRRALA